MALAGVAAAALCDFTSVRRYMLTIAGVDMILAPGNGGGNRAGISIDTVHVSQVGPGGVSKLDGTIDDPGSTITVSDGDEVQLWNLANNDPLFAGWIDHRGRRPGFGIGRSITFSATGAEALLDWSKLIADLTVLTGTPLGEAIQIVASAAVGVGPLRAFRIAPPFNYGVGGITVDDFPIARFPLNALSYDVVIPAGTTLREALSMINTAAADSSTVGIGFDSVQVPSNLRVTVDPRWGLRCIRDQAGGWVPTAAYPDLTVTDTVAGPIRAEGLSDELDAAGIVRGVYVKGLNAAGSGLMLDGTGKLGEIATINDPSCDTATKLAQAQYRYLVDNAPPLRGSFRLEDWTPTAGVVVGSNVILTDASTGATGTYRIMQIDRTFLASGRETWIVTYGGLQPSAANLIRRLTRSTLS